MMIEDRGSVSLVCCFYERSCHFICTLYNLHVHYYLLLKCKLSCSSANLICVRNLFAQELPDLEHVMKSKQLHPQPPYFRLKSNYLQSLSYRWDSNFKNFYYIVLFFSFSLMVLLILTSQVLFCALPSLKRSPLLLATDLLRMFTMSCCRLLHSQGMRLTEIPNNHSSMLRR